MLTVYCFSVAGVVMKEDGVFISLKRRADGEYEQVLPVDDGVELAVLGDVEEDVGDLPVDGSQEHLVPDDVEAVTVERAVVHFDPIVEAIDDDGNRSYIV